MKITKKNWPAWAFGIASVSFLVMMSLFDHVTGPSSYWLYPLLAIAVGGSLSATITLLIRAFKAGLLWRNEPESKNDRTKRTFGFVAALIITLPAAYFLMAFLMLVLGFMSLGIQQKMSY
jgi:hypothetical protein